MTLIHGAVKKAYLGGANTALQPEEMIALLQTLAANLDNPEQMAWLHDEYPAVYEFVDGVDPALLVKGRTDPLALQQAAKDIGEKIRASLDTMRWDDLGLSPSYEAAAKRLFPRGDWNFIQDLAGQDGKLEPRFIMEEDAFRPLIPGQERLDQRAFDWDMSNDLEAHLSKLGVTKPDVLQIELGSFIHRLRNDYLHVPPIDGALLMDARALSTRGERLGDGADRWTFARRMGDDNRAAVPIEYALGMRGVAYGLEDPTPESVRGRCATRIAQRVSGDENAVIRTIDGQEHVVIPDPTGQGADKVLQPLDVKLERIDGRDCVVLPTGDARVLMAPIALGDPAAKFSTKRQTLLPDATGFEGENAVFLVQAAKLAYQDAESIALYSEAWGLRDAKLIEHAASDGQCYLAYDEEKNTIVMAFRGTESRADIFVDADFGLDDSDYFPDCRVHSGFLEQFEGLMPEVTKELTKLNEAAASAGKQPPAIMVGGHSLGGALAGMFTYWGLKNDLNIKQTYTCGEPAWADKTGVLGANAALTKSGCNYFRFVNNNDIVPRASPRCDHVGTELYINHQGKLEQPGILGGMNRIKDRLAGIVENWSTSSGIDSVDAVSDHYVDFYLGYARKNRGVRFALDAAKGVVGTALEMAAGAAAHVVAAVVPGDDGHSSSDK